MYLFFIIMPDFPSCIAFDELTVFIECYVYMALRS